MLKTDDVEKNRVGILTMIYNEKNIIEWMKHHYSCGFDFILIYDDYSEPSVKSIINEYGKFNKNKYLVLEKLEPKFFIGNFVITTFYEHLKIPIKENMDYCLRIDLDEYLYLSDFKNIHEVIDYYSPFDQLNIYWKLFSGNFLKTNKTKSCIEVFTKSENDVRPCPKSLAKVSYINGLNNPHVFTPYPGKTFINKDTFNNIYIPGPNGMPPSSLNDKLYKHDLKKKTIYIAHYRVRDIEEYLNRRYISISNLIKKSHAPLRWLKLFGYHGKDIMKNGWMFSDPNINDAIEYIFNQQNKEGYDTPNLIISQFNDNSNEKVFSKESLDDISKLWWHLQIGLNHENFDLFNYNNIRKLKEN